MRQGDKGVQGDKGETGHIGPTGETGNMIVLFDSA